MNLYAQAFKNLTGLDPTPEQRFRVKNLCFPLMYSNFAADLSGDQLLEYMTQTLRTYNVNYLISGDNWNKSQEPADNQPASSP